MIFKYLFFIIVTLFSLNCNSNNIRVINLDLIVNQNISFQELINKIENDQSIHRDNLLKIENDLSSKLEEIEELKLILSSKELQNEIEIYNSELNKFNEKVNNFNLHYDKQLNNMKNKILDKILELIKEYSMENKIDLIIESKSYIMASNSIDISQIIIEKLNNIKFETNFKKFE